MPASTTLRGLVQALGNMMKFSCQSIQSGVTDWEVWVSLGFSSETYGERDVVHIVCGFHNEEEPIEGIWLERTDQSQGGLDLAKSVSLLPDRIRIELTTKGIKTLGFNSETIEFGFENGQSGLEDLRSTMLEMKNDPNGFQVRVA